MRIDRHHVLPTREARAGLSKMLAEFRKGGRDARPYVIGSHRKPEAVVVSYEQYVEMVEQIADVEVRSVVEGRLATAGSSEVDLDAIAAEHGLAPEDYRNLE